MPIGGAKGSLGAGALAPVLSSPVDTKTDHTTATLSITTNEGNGTVYWVVTSSATAPTAAQIISGLDDGGAAAVDSGSQAVTATGAQAISGGAAGLLPSTGYYTYYVHQDQLGNNSPVSTADGFTTDPSPDSVAPILSAATDTKTGTTTADVGVTTDEGNGTIYWVITTSATKPNQAQIIAGDDHTDTAATASGNITVTSTGAKTDSATGLTRNTTYYAHFTHQDDAGNNALVVSGDGFLTDEFLDSQTFGTAGNHSFTVPSSYTGLEVTVRGGSGGGGGGDGGQGGEGIDTGAVPTGRGSNGAGGSSGSSGTASRFNASEDPLQSVDLVSNAGGGGSGGSGSSGSNGTASGGDTNTTGGGPSGGSGGSGGGGGNGCGIGTDDGFDGDNGQSGGRSGLCVKEYDNTELTASQSISVVVGSRGDGGDGGSGGSGASGAVCSGDSGESGDAGNDGAIGDVTIKWW